MIYDTKDYITSRRAYIFQCMFEYFIALSCTDAYLAKLLKSIGLSDAVTGVVSSLIMFTFLFQLISIPLAGKLKKIKKPVIALDTLSQLLFASVFLVPFLPISDKLKAYAVITLILWAYLALYLNTTICYKWGNSFVSPDKRGDFSAVKEMISLLSGVFFTLFTGYMIDRFEANGNLKGGFLFLGLTMVAVCTGNFICLSRMKEVPLAESGAEQSLKEVFYCTFRNKPFRNTMILTAITEISRYITIGFMGTYKTVDLGLSLTKIQFINVASCLARFAVSKPIGRYSDVKGFANGFYLGNVINTLAFVAGIFMTKKLWWIVIPFTVLLQTGYAGTNQNTYNMAYSFVDEEHILSAIAVNNSVRGLFSFGASFVGSFIVDAVQKQGGRLFGIPLSAQQLLCCISVVLCLVSLLFNKKVVCRQAEDKK